MRLLGTSLGLVMVCGTAIADPEVLAPPVPEFYTNGLLGVPAYGSFATLEYVPGTQLWPNVMLGVSAGGFEVAIAADASPSYVWIQAGDRVVVDRLSLPKVGLRFSYGIAGASRDVRDYRLQQGCERPDAGIVRGECGADAAGAMLPGATVSLGVYGQSIALGRIDGLATELILQYAYGRATAFLSGTTRLVASYHDDLGPRMLETFEVGGQGGLFYRIYGGDEFGTLSVTAGVTGRYLWSGYDGPMARWTASENPDSFEGWLSGSIRAGSVALTAGIGHRWRVEGPIDGKRSTLERTTPVMLALQYSL